MCVCVCVCVCVCTKLLRIPTTSADVKPYYLSVKYITIAIYSVHCTSCLFETISQMLHPCVYKSTLDM